MSLIPLCSYPLASFLSASEDLFNLFDENGDGNIDFPEMVQGVAVCCRRLLKEKAECKTLFSVLRCNIYGIICSINFSLFVSPFNSFLVSISHLFPCTRRSLSTHTCDIILLHWCLISCLILQCVSSCLTVTLMAIFLGQDSLTSSHAFLVFRKRTNRQTNLATVLR